MNNRPGSRTRAAVHVPVDSARDLLTVSDAEWIAECDRWLSVEIKRTFSLVRDGTVLDPPALSRAARDLASLSNTLMVPADRHGLEGRFLWEFGMYLTSFAGSAKLEQLGQAISLVPRVSGVVMSLRNRLVQAQRKASEGATEAAAEWDRMDPRQREDALLRSAQQEDHGTIVSVVRDVARTTGSRPATVRSWVYRHGDFKERLWEFIRPRPTR